MRGNHPGGVHCAVVRGWDADRRGRRRLLPLWWLIDVAVDDITFANVSINGSMVTKENFLSYFAIGGECAPEGVYQKLFRMRPRKILK